MLSGWCLGIAISPYTAAEQKSFARVGQVVSVLISGYAVSKFDRFLERVLFGPSGSPNSDIWVRLALFLGATAVGCLFDYSNQAYFRSNQKPVAPAASKKTYWNIRFQKTPGGPLWVD